MTSTITITYDSSNTDAIKAINILKGLDNVRVSRSMLKKPRKSALDRADDDIKAGRVYKAKNGRDLVEQCLK